MAKAWALSTNLYTWGQLLQGFFGWPISQNEGETIRGMNAGDLIVPKFAQSSTYDTAGSTTQRNYLESLGLDFDAALESYNSTIRSGAGAVPYILRVTGSMADDARSGEPWARVSIDVEELTHPLSTQEFLRHRAIPPEVAAQFKGTVSPGRHLQPLPTSSAADEIRATGMSPDRKNDLRRYSLVRATQLSDVSSKLSAVGRDPVAGDRVFVASSSSLIGVCEPDEVGGVHAISSPVPRSPSEVRDLLEDAKSKAKKSDYFSPSNAVAACEELQDLLDGSVDVIAIDDFARWHDRYHLLNARITQADSLALRTELGDGAASGHQSATNEPEAESDEAALLAGLTVEAVREQLPAKMAVPDAVLAEAVTALRAGKHLLLGGPPGTGKSTIAEAIARAVMGSNYLVTTGTADWTTFDTIGGYLPDSESGVAFAPGVVLRALRSGAWLIIDELNRADIDRAFGPLFTLLNGDSASSRHSVLPYSDADGKPVSIKWADARRTDADYTMTPNWRLIGTLNVADKSSLFQLSFAFLRRFAVIDVPLPPSDMYRTFIEGLFSELAPGSREQVVDAVHGAAFGPRQIGPAIVADLGEFVEKAIVPTAAGTPAYSDAIEALLVAFRILVVPQYEGAEPGAGAQLIGLLRTSLGGTPAESFEHLRTALDEVALR